MYNDASAASNKIEHIRFLPGPANPVTVLLSARGATVSRQAAGIYLVTLAPQNQCDPSQRTIVISVGAVGAVPSFAQQDITANQTDQTFLIYTFLPQGSPADTDAEITVEVSRATNVG